MIEINNLTTNQIDEEFLKRVAKTILAEEKKGKTALSIALVGQGRIRELNKKYTRDNRVPDVLAFPNREVGLGEIVICLQEVNKNTKRFNSTFEIELARVLTHGILHLLGYNHEKAKRKAKDMEVKQNYYLKKIFKNF